MRFFKRAEKDKFFKKARLTAVAGAAFFTMALNSGSIYDSITLDELVAVVAGTGLDYNLNGEMIDIRSGPFIGVTGCNTQGSCTDVMIMLSLEDVTPTLDQVNEWNQTRKIPEASINSDGTLLFEHYMTAKGITSTAIVDTIDWFWKAISDDKEFWSKSEPTS